MYIRVGALFRYSNALSSSEYSSSPPVVKIQRININVEIEFEMCMKQSNVDIWSENIRYRVKKVVVVA